jgi:hypothetical protein
MPAVVDVVEEALAMALRDAVEKGRSDAVIAALAAELKARREARSAPGIVDLEAERRKRR